MGARAVSSDAANDLAFCRRRVLENDPWFSLHNIFAPAQRKEQILALHALFAALERALLLSEESLILSQLNWWQGELQPEQALLSAHPVVRVLKSSGVLKSLSQDIIAALLSQALDRLGIESISDEAGLRSLCDRVGRVYLSAECAIGVDKRPSPHVDLNCAGTGLSVLLGSALRSAAMPLWFLPLTLQARHGCDSRAICAGSEDAVAVLRALDLLAAEWFGDQLVQMQRAQAGLPANVDARRHLFAWVLSDRQKTARSLQVMWRQPPAGIARWRAADFLRVWGGCRKLTRSGESSHEQ